MHNTSKILSHNLWIDYPHSNKVNLSTRRSEYCIACISILKIIFSSSYTLSYLARTSYSIWTPSLLLRPESLSEVFLSASTYMCLGICSSLPEGIDPKMFSAPLLFFVSPIPLPSVSIKPQVSRLWVAITMAAQFSIDDAFALDGDEEGAVSDAEPERWGGKDGHREGGEMTFGPLSFAKPQTHPSPAASASLEHSNLKYQVVTHIFLVGWIRMSAIHHWILQGAVSDFLFFLKSLSLWYTFCCRGPLPSRTVSSSKFSNKCIEICAHYHLHREPF